jgi:ATP-dependent RNA helicase DDX52/ROK1
MKDSGCDIPDWMLALKTNKNDKKKLKQSALNRDSIKTISSYDEQKQKRKREMVEASIRKQQKMK